MEKLKKFKIIESGRINTLEELELSQIKGGGEECVSTYQHCVSQYVSCTRILYRSCTVATSLTGYESQGTDVFCDSGYIYNQCPDLVGPYDTCAVDKTYSTFR